MRAYDIVVLVFALLGIFTAADVLAEDSIESNFLSNVRQVTSGMTKAGEGYFSPDGTEIVYQAEPLQFPFYQIYRQKLSGGEPQRLSTGRGRTTCSYFSPDGKRNAYQLRDITSAPPVPEPSTVMLIGTCLAGLALLRLRRAKS